MASNFWVSPNSVLIECPIVPTASGTNAKNPFGTQKQLQGKKIVAVEAYSSQDIVNSPISNTNCITTAVFQTSFVTFYRASTPATATSPQQNEGLYYDQIPLSRLRIVTNQLNSGAGLASSSCDMFRVVPTEFSWTKSYITCAPSVPIAVNMAAVFLIHYLNEGQDWRPYGQ